MQLSNAHTLCRDYSEGFRSKFSFCLMRMIIDHLSPCNMAVKADQLWAKHSHQHGSVAAVVVEDEPHCITAEANSDLETV
jgi:hypothetical protein